MKNTLDQANLCCKDKLLSDVPNFLARQSHQILDIAMVTYGNDIDDATISRYIACISPFLRCKLPTYDIRMIDGNSGEEIFSTKIAWTTQEL